MANLAKSAKKFQFKSQLVTLTYRRTLTNSCPRSFQPVYTYLLALKPMKRIAPTALLIIFLSLFCTSGLLAQNLTGIWRGYFISEDGEQYKLEFQVKQNQTLAVTGVSYSYLDVRFYGKATMTGNYNRDVKKMRIKEIKTVEVKSSSGGGTCIMNYDLAYSKSGREEFLEGTYLGKQEIKSGENPFKWGDCGKGVVYLRKVTTSNFYVEPFLRKENLTPPPVKKTPVVPKKETPMLKNSPAKKPATTPKKNVTAVPKKIEKPVTKPPIDSVVKKPEIKKEIERPVVVNTPAVLKERENELMKALIVNSPDVTIKIFDNGTIDDDTISVYLDKKLILSKKRLTASPLVIQLKMDEVNSEHELVMVADNLGRIPPNTSLMIVEAGDQRFDVRITSTEQKNALVRFKYRAK